METAQTTQLTVKLETPELKAIEPSKAEQIRRTFEPMVEMLSGFEETYNEVIEKFKDGITKELTSRAKRLRLDIGRVRIEAEKIRKAQKEEYLRAGKAIDGVNNLLKWAVVEKENKLKEIEDYYEIQEQKRLEALQIERVEMLAPYVEDAEERDLSSMDDDVWSAYYQAKKKAYEDEQEAIRKAEQERIEKERIQKIHNERREQILPYYSFWEPELHQTNLGQMKDSQFQNILQSLKQEKEDYDAEQEKIRIENEKLQKEKALAEKKRAAEEKARKEREEQERKEREEKERKEREAYEAKIEAERKERERIEKELKQKQEQEQKRIEQAEAKRQAELQKDDQAKIADLISELENLKSKYNFKSKANKKMYETTGILLDKVVGHIRATSK